MMRRMRLLYGTPVLPPPPHICQTLSKRQTDGRTNERTDRRRESNLVHIRFKMWHLVAIVLRIFLIINLPNFVYLLVDAGFLSPFKFLWSIAVPSPIGWTPLTDTADKATRLSVCSVRSFVRLWDGVCHSPRVLRCVPRRNLPVVYRRPKSTSGQQSITFSEFGGLLKIWRGRLLYMSFKCLPKLGYFSHLPGHG